MTPGHSAMRRIPVNDLIGDVVRDSFREGRFVTMIYFDTGRFLILTDYPACEHTIGAFDPR